MGKELYCDLCRATIAIEAGLKPILIGENKIAEVCLTCASRLEQGLKNQISDVEKEIIMAKKAIQAPSPKAEAQAPTEPAVLSKEEIKAKIDGGISNG